MMTTKCIFCSNANITLFGFLAILCYIVQSGKLEGNNGCGI